MVLLVLAIVWGVLLVSWLRSRRQDTASLTRSARSADTSRCWSELRRPPSRRPTGSVLVGSPGHVIPAYRPRGVLRGPVIPAGSWSERRRGLRPPSAAALRRRQAQKRRRDVFFALLAGVVGSLPAGHLPRAVDHVVRAGDLRHRLRPSTWPCWSGPQPGGRAGAQAHLHAVPVSAPPDRGRPTTSATALATATWASAGPPTESGSGAGGRAGAAGRLRSSAPSASWLRRTWRERRDWPAAGG